MSFKEVNISNPGTSSKFGANDLDLITKLLNGVTSGIPAVQIKSSNKFGFGDAILWVWNQAATKKTTIRGQSNAPSVDVDLTLPPITGNDVLAALGVAQAFTVKQQFNAGVLFQAQSLPASPASGIHHLVVDSADGHLKKKNSAGTVVDYDSFVGGGEVNTITNIGTGGVGVYKQKTGVNFELKKINAGSSSVTITDDTANNEVDINVVDATTSLKGKVLLGINTDTAAGLVIQANDSRLTNARAPTAHALSHKSGQSDVIKLDEFGTPTDNTNLNVTISYHGLAPKAPNDATKYLDGTGAWTVPAGSGGSVPDAT